MNPTNGMKKEPSPGIKKAIENIKPIGQEMPEKQEKIKKPGKPKNLIPDNMHISRCSVCKHPKLKLLENEFLTGATYAALSRNYGLDPVSIYNHMIYFQIHLDREVNILKVCGQIINRVNPAESEHLSEKVITTAMNIMAKSQVVETKEITGDIHLTAQELVAAQVKNLKKRMRIDKSDVAVSDQN